MLANRVRMSCGKYKMNWVAVMQSYAKIVVSKDGENWQIIDLSTPAVSLYDITYANGLYVAVGQQGLIVVSNDGINWKQVDSGISSTLNGISYINNIWVAVGNHGTILTSLDGYIWQTKYTRTDIDYYFQKAVYGKGVYVVVGADYNLHGCVYTSPDTVTWTQQYENLTIKNVFTSVTFDGSMFVAVGQGGRLSCSSNGTHWGEMTSNFDVTTINEIKYYNGLFVAVGDAGKIGTSTTGTSFTLKTGYTTKDIYGLTYGDGKWISVGITGKIGKSLDGNVWSLLVDNSSYGALMSVAYGGE